MVTCVYGVVTTATAAALSLGRNVIALIVSRICDVHMQWQEQRCEGGQPACVDHFSQYLKTMHWLGPLQ